MLKFALKLLKFIAYITLIAIVYFAVSYLLGLIWAWYQEKFNNRIYTAGAGMRQGSKMLNIWIGWMCILGVISAMYMYPDYSIESSVPPLLQSVVGWSAVLPIYGVIVAFAIAALLGYDYDDTYIPFQTGEWREKI